MSTTTRCAVFMVTLVLAGPAAAQQTFTWSGLGLSNLWTIGPNWQGNIPPSSTPFTAIILTGDAQTANVMNMGGLALNSLTFAGEAGPFSVTQSSSDFFNFFPTPGANALPHIDQFSSSLQTLHFENTGLQLNSDLVLGGSGTGTLAINGQLLAVGGTGRLFLTGPYTVSLSTAVANTTAGIFLNAGTLRVNNDIAFGNGVLTFGGGTLQLINNLAITRSLVLNAGGGTIDASGFTASMTGTSFTVTGAGRLTFTNTSGTGSATVNAQLQQSGGLLVTGANNTVTLGGNGNSYTGGTTINAGATLAVDSDFRLGNTSASITIDGGTLKLIYPSGYTTNRPVTLGPGGGTISIDSTVATVGFNAAIGGAGGLTKTGTGHVALLAANSYIGPTNVTAGFLDLVNNLAVQSTTVTLNGGTLGFVGANVPVLGGLAGPTSLLFNSVNSFSVGNNNASTTYAGSLSGSLPGGLAKIGAGTWTLTGTNTQSGPFNIQAGTVAVGSAGALSPNAPVTVAAGATLDLGGFNYTVPASVPLTIQGTLRFNGASLAVASGGTATYNGATMSNGVLRGPGTHVVTGGAILSGVSTFNSTGINQTGAGTLQNFSNSGPFTISAGSVSKAIFDGFINQGSGSITIGAASAVNAADFQSYGLLTFTPSPSLLPPTLLTNTGTSALYFNGGSRTFVGTPATAQFMEAGLDLHGQNLVLAGGLFVNNGFVADGVGGGSVIVDYGGLYKGAGTSFVPIVTQNGGKLMAGNSPGYSVLGELTIGPGAVNNFVWQINDAGPSTTFPNAPGKAGPTADASDNVSGWSEVQSNIIITPRPPFSKGNLTWTATSVPGHQFNFALETLLGPTTPVGQSPDGLMTNFDPTQRYVWPFITYQGTYSGPTDSATLTAGTLFDTSEFANPINGTFTIQLDLTNKAMDLVYTPVPEPGTLGLVVVAAFGWVTFWRRRWRLNGQLATPSA